MKQSLSLLFILWAIALFGCTNTIGGELIPSSGHINLYEDVQERDFEGYVVLGRATLDSMTVRITPKDDGSYKVIYGENLDQLTMETEIIKTTSKEPVTFLLDGLESDQEYGYKIITFNEQNIPTYCGYTNVFQTAKTGEASYKFAIQSDSHFNTKADLDVYKEVFESMDDFNPDFLIDLGDTFINDYFMDSSYENVNQRYYDHLAYFNILTQSTPLYLVLGNHEGEYGYFRDDTSDNLLIYATQSRKEYYPNPVPDDFYSGNTEVESLVGQPENYYAYTWGDALYVMIDPYRYTTTNPEGSSMWDWTLGLDQYNWLKETLEASDAQFKFMFAHHAIGNVRGSSQITSLFEWGGHERNGRYLFDKYRPEFDMPIHDLMVENDVDIFFQGHDHIYAREVIDGIVYQTLPKPAESVPDIQNNLDAYGDVVQINSGYLEVYVEPDYVQVDYKRMIVSSDHDSDATGIVNSYRLYSTGELINLVETDDTEAFIEYINTDYVMPKKKRDTK